MDIQIQGHNIRVNESLEAFTRKKLERFDRYLPNITDIRVELTHQNTRRGEDVSTAQITVRHKRGAILRAQESIQGDIETALNDAVDKMHRQIERFKGKRSHKGRERFALSVDELNAAEAIPGLETNGASEFPEQEDVSIIRRKTVAIIAMNEEEAVEQMELLGHNFFVFHDEQTGGVSIVYKRTAGGYGILVPQLT